LITSAVRSAYEKLLDHDGQQGWACWLAGDTVAGTVGTTHLGLLQYPHVRRTAEIIEAELDLSQKGSHAPVAIPAN
jgi:hypothetical protein